MTEIRTNTFDIRGVKFRNTSADVAALKSGDLVNLTREPTNEFDPNAVACTSGGRFLGYMPKELARYLSPMMNEGLKLHAVIKQTEPVKMLITVVLVWDKED